MEMKSRWVAAAAAAVVFALSVSCAQDKEADLAARAREIHERVLTVDTHCDTPMAMWAAVSIWA